MNAAGEKKEYKSVPTPISALQQLRGKPIENDAITYAVTSLLTPKRFNERREDHTLTSSASSPQLSWANAHNVSPLRGDKSHKTSNHQIQEACDVPLASVIANSKLGLPGIKSKKNTEPFRAGVGLLSAIVSNPSDISFRYDNLSSNTESSPIKEANYSNRNSLQTESISKEMYLLQRRTPDLSNASSIEKLLFDKSQLTHLSSGDVVQEDADQADDQEQQFVNNKLPTLESQQVEFQEQTQPCTRQSVNDLEEQRGLTPWQDVVRSLQPDALLGGWAASDETTNISSSPDSTLHPVKPEKKIHDSTGVTSKRLRLPRETPMQGKPAKTVIGPPPSKIPKRFHLKSTSPLPPLAERLSSNKKALHSFMDATYRTDQHIWEKIVFPSAHPSGRFEVLLLASTLSTLLTELHNSSEDTEEDINMQILKGFNKIDSEIVVWDIGIGEIVRQVYVHCVERGKLLDAARCRIVEILQYMKHITKTCIQSNIKQKEPIQESTPFKTNESECSKDINPTNCTKCDKLSHESMMWRLRCKELDARLQSMRKSLREAEKQLQQLLPDKPNSFLLWVQEELKASNTSENFELITRDAEVQCETTDPSIEYQDQSTQTGCEELDVLCVDSLLDDNELNQIEDTENLASVRDMDGKESVDEEKSQDLSPKALEEESLETQGLNAEENSTIAEYKNASESDGVNQFDSMIKDPLEENDLIKEDKGDGLLESEYKITLDRDGIDGFEDDQDTEFEDKEFEDTEFEGKEFEGKEFEGKEFEGKEFEDTEFEDTEFEGKEFEGIEFEDKNEIESEPSDMERNEGGNSEEEGSISQCNTEVDRTSENNTEDELVENIEFEHGNSLARSIAVQTLWTESMIQELSCLLGCSDLATLDPSDLSWSQTLHSKVGEGSRESLVRSPAQLAKSTRARRNSTIGEFELGKKRDTNTKRKQRTMERPSIPSWVSNTPPGLYKLLNGGKGIKSAVVKKPAWLLNLINDLYTEKIMSDQSCDKERMDRKVLDVFLFEWLKQKYGLRKLAIKHTLSVLATTAKYKAIHPRIIAFARFLQILPPQLGYHEIKRDSTKQNTDAGEQDTFCTPEQLEAEAIAKTERDATTLAAGLDAYLLALNFLRIQTSRVKLPGDVDTPITNGSHTESKDAQDYISVSEAHPRNLVSMFLARQAVNNALSDQSDAFRDQVCQIVEKYAKRVGNSAVVDVDTVMCIIAREAEAEERRVYDKLCDLFTAADENGDGELSLEELESIVQSALPSVTPEQTQELYNEIQKVAIKLAGPLTQDAFVTAVRAYTRQQHALSLELVNANFNAEVSTSPETKPTDQDPN